MRQFTQLFLFGLLLGVLPSHASAQNKNNDAEESKKQKEAQKLFDQAEKLYNIGDFTGALNGYKEAYLLSNNPDLLFNMGQCYKKLERYEEALTTYKSYLREVPNSPVQADVEARIAEVEKLLAANQVSRLVITSNPTGAEVHKGGANSRVIGVTPYTEEKLSAGEYHFTLTRKGYQPYEFDLNVEGGKDYTIPEAKLLPEVSGKPVWAYRLSVNSELLGSGDFFNGNPPNVSVVSGAAAISLERFTDDRKKSYGLFVNFGGGGGAAAVGNRGAVVGTIGAKLSSWRPSQRRPLWSRIYSVSAGVFGVSQDDVGDGGVYARGHLQLFREGEYRGGLYLVPLSLGVTAGPTRGSLELGLLGVGYSWGLRNRNQQPE